MKQTHIKNKLTEQTTFNSSHKQTTFSDDKQLKSNITNMKISSTSKIIVALISCIDISNIFCSAVSFRGSIKDNTFAFEGQEGSHLENISFFANCDTKTQCTKYGSKSCANIYNGCNKQCKWNPSANNGKGLCENNKPGPRPSPPLPHPGPRPSPSPPRPNPRPSPPTPLPNPRPSPPTPRPNPRPSPPPPPPSSCHGHESNFYSNHTDCGPGGLPEAGKMYLYAVPRCQSVELYDLDKVWGGAHISLGKWKWNETQEIAKFNDLKKWLANTSQFKKDSSWHPTKSVLNPIKKPDLKCGLHWYAVYINTSKTLNKIRDHIQRYYAVQSPMGSNLHISAIPSGTHKTAKLDDILDVITDSNVDWVVVLVKVVQGKDGKKYIERQGEAKILATMS